MSVFGVEFTIDDTPRPQMPSEEQLGIRAQFDEACRLKAWVSAERLQKELQPEPVQRMFDDWEQCGEKVNPALRERPSTGHVYDDHDQQPRPM